MKGLFKVRQNRARLIRKMLKRSLLVFLSILLGIYLLLYFYFNPYLKSQIEKTVFESSDQLYLLDIDYLNVSLIYSHVNMRGFHLRVNPEEVKKRARKRANGNYLDLELKVAKLKVEGIHWLKFLFSKRLHIESILLDQPDIYSLNQRLSTRQEAANELSGEVVTIFSKFCKELILDEFAIRDSKVDIEARRSKEVIMHEADKFGFSLNGLHIHTHPDSSALANIKFGDAAFVSDSYRFYSTTGGYQFQFDQLNISTLDSIFRLTDFKVIPRDSSQANFLAQKKSRLDLKVKEVKASGLDFKRMIYQQEIDLDHLLIDQLKLDLARPASRVKKSSPSGKDKSPDRDALKKAVLGIPLFVHLDKVELKNASLLIKDVHPQKPEEVLSYHQLDTVSLTFRHFSLGPAIDTSLNQALNSRNVALDIKHYTHLNSPGMTKLYIEQAKISARDSVLLIRNASLKPLVSNEEFSARTQHQKMLIDAQVELVQANHLDFERMAFQQEFILGRVDLIAPRFKAYVDKRKPKKRNQKYQNFEAMLRSIPLFIEVDTFSMKDAAFEYLEQKKPKGQESQESQFARHQAQSIDLQITDAQFGLAAQGSAFENIEKKSLRLGLENYQYFSSNGDYQLGIRRVQVSSLSQSIRIDSLKFNPNRSPEEFAQRNAYRYSRTNIAIDQLFGGRVNFKRLLRRQEIDWGSLKLINPRLRIYQDLRPPKRPKSKPAPSDNQNKILASAPPTPLPAATPQKKEAGLRKILKELPVYIKIDTFQVINAALDYQTQSPTQSGSGRASHQVDHINFIFPQIRLGKATEDPDFAHFYSGNFLFTLKNYHFQDKEGTFRISLKHIKSSLKDSLLAIQSITYKPLLTREKFVAVHPYRSLFLDAELNRIEINTIDLDRLLFDQEIFLKELIIREPQLKLFSDKRKPKKPRPVGPKKSFEDILESLPIHIEMDTFALVDARLTYESLASAKNQDKTALSRHRIEKLNLSAQNLALGISKYPTRFHKADRLLYSDDFRLSLDNYTFEMPNKEYLISVDHIEGSMADSLLDLSNITYKPLLSRSSFDSLYSFRKAQYDIKVDQMQLKFGDLRHLPDDETLVLRRLALNDADIKIYQNALKPKKSPKKPLKPEEIFSQLPFHLQVDQLALQNARLFYLSKKENKKGKIIQSIQKADSISLVLQQFRLNKNQEADPTRIFYADEVGLRLANYHSLSGDSLYHLTLKSLEIQTADSSLQVKDFRVYPTVTDPVFNSYQRYETDRYDVSVHSLDIQGLDYLSLLQRQELFARSISIDEVIADIYRDKRLDDDPNKRPSMPHSAFQKINLPLKVDLLEIKNSKVIYKEKVEKGLGTGEVFFHDFNLQVSQLNTDQNLQDTTHIRLQGKLMGEGLLTLHLKIPLKSDSLMCSYEGSLVDMDAAYFNQFIKSNQHMKIKDGYIDEIAYQVSMDRHYNSGTMAAGFKKLKIEFLNKKDHEKKKGMLSFLANLIIHNNKSTRRRNSKSSRIKYEAEPSDGFVKILWKSLASGLVRTLL